jgi:hypothetical protein
MVLTKPKGPVNSNMAKYPMSQTLSSTTARLFGKRFWMWAICHSLSSDFCGVSELEKKFKQINPLAIFLDIEKPCTIPLTPGFKLS